VLRTTLALAALTKKKVHIENIRASRPKPGLRPQHLAAVRTIAEICCAETSGVEPGSAEIIFLPKKLSPTNFSVNIGTAGSISLLLSQVLPVSLLVETKLHVLGGTNVPFSPPLEFLQESLFPALHKPGARFEARLVRRGYFPKGNGAVIFSSKKARLPLKPINISNFGSLEFVKVYSHCVSLPGEVAKNQAAAAKHYLASLGAEFDELIECKPNSRALGSGISLFAHFSSGNILAGSALGKKKLPAEKVGLEAAKSLLKELAPKKACDSHLADQLIPFMALAKGESRVETTCLTEHCLTNIAVVEKFLPVKFEVVGQKNFPATISVKGIGFSG